MSLVDLLPLQAVPTSGQITARAINTATKTVVQKSRISFSGNRNRRLNSIGRKLTRSEVDRKVSELSDDEEAVLGTVLKLIRVAMGRFASGSSPIAERHVPESLLATYGKVKLERMMMHEAKKFFAPSWHKAITLKITYTTVQLSVCVKHEPQIKYENRLDRLGRTYQQFYVSL